MFELYCVIKKSGNTCSPRFGADASTLGPGSGVAAGWALRWRGFWASGGFLMDRMGNGWDRVAGSTMGEFSAARGQLKCRRTNARTGRRTELAQSYFQPTSSVDNQPMHARRGPNHRLTTNWQGFPFFFFSLFSFLFIFFLFLFYEKLQLTWWGIHASLSLDFVAVEFVSGFFWFICLLLFISFIFISLTLWSAWSFTLCILGVEPTLPLRRLEVSIQLICSSYPFRMVGSLEVKQF